ncbi:zinc-binding dehydrogenase [Rhodococcus koreensis]
MRGVVVENGSITLADDLEVRPPGPHEVGVQVVASGLCASDLILLTAPDPTPAVLGHEAAGIVTSVGEHVEDIAVGQLVSVTCQRPCMKCKACASRLYSACATTMYDPDPLFRWRGQPVRSLARVSSLASQITVDAFQVHPISNLDAPAAALIGCAVSTGYGSVRNIARVDSTDSVVVIGVGGIGINSIQTARLLGARHIVAVDTNADKDALSLQFGADQFVHVDPSWSVSELADHLSAAIGDTVDVVIECTGQPTVIAASVALLGIGGRLALVGISPRNPVAELDIPAVMAKHITVSSGYNGACDPFVDFPTIVRLAEQGRLDLAGQVSHRFPLDRIDEAISALRGGKVLRVVVDMVT